LSFMDSISRIRKANDDPLGKLRVLAHRMLLSCGGGFMTSAQSEWAGRMRSQVEMDFLWLSEWCAKKDLEEGDNEVAMRLVSRALDLDPYSESLNSLTFELLAKAGKLRELATAYQRYVTSLRENLGIDPPRAVREGYGKLMAEIVE